MTDCKSFAYMWRKLVNVLFLKIVTNLKSRDYNRANAPNILSCADTS